MRNFLEALRIQRWDDHRYYHHSQVNQALHFLSAISFCIAYLVVFKDPAMAAVIGWVVSMTSRQIGHFFFEPRDYDTVNQATDEYKEAIKVGYNIKRKIVLVAIWAASPLLVWYSPSLFGTAPTPQTTMQWIRQVGYLWFVVGIGGLLFRVIQLCFTRDPQTGFVWATKIVTDPFHDIKLYWKAPYRLLRRSIEDVSLASDEQDEPLDAMR
jgi:type IV secretory pathway VirB3-like protein